MDKWTIIEIPFKKKSSGKSCTFSGILEVLVDEFNIVYDFKFTVDNCKIDIFTTNDWFSKESDCHGNFIKRQKLFKLLNLEQKRRPKKGIRNELVTLNDDQIDKLNSFYYEDKKNTIKGIITLIQGSNPSGEASNPTSGQLVTDFKDKELPFALLLKNLRVKIANRNYFIDMCKHEARLISFETWLEENKFMIEKFSVLIQKKNRDQYRKIKNGFEDWVKRYRKGVSKKDFNNAITRKRSEYYSSVKEKYPENIINKEFKFKLRQEYDYAHLKGVGEIKKQIGKQIFKGEDFESKKIKSLLNEIADPENFLPLPKTIHAIYDKNNIITYNEFGQIIRICNDSALDNIFLNIRSELEEHNLWHLSDSWLTKKRRKYLVDHLNNIKKTNT